MTLVNNPVMGINLRKNKNTANAGYGKYYPKVDIQKATQVTTAVVLAKDPTSIDAEIENDSFTLKIAPVKLMLSGGDEYC